MTFERIAVITTGGTIAGLATSANGAYEAGVVSGRALLSASLAAPPHGTLSVTELASIDSKDATPALWSQLRQAAQILLDDPGVDGVVVTHGTDTLEDSAYFLHLTLRSEKPVVFTAAMRPSDALSADGPVNLVDALRVAAHPSSAGQGVLVVMNGRILSARDVSKTDTSHLDAMQSPGVGPLGLVDASGPVWYHRTVRRHTLKSEVAEQGSLPRVEIFYAYPGARLMLEASPAVDAADLAGIVFAGTGNGTMPAQTQRQLADAAARGIAIVRSSRAGGRVQAGVAMDDAFYGFVSGDNLSPQKVRVLLMLALLKTKDRAALQAIFDTH